MLISGGIARCPVIAIIGGGFCGTLTAVHLLRRGEPGARIVLIERGGECGPGVAYATRDDRHLLNVPAARMSALADEPDDFSEWACVAPDAFVPRRVYGEYLRAQLASAAARSAARLERVTATVVGLRPARGAIELSLAGGGRLACDRAVLAVGSLAPGAACALPDDPWVIADPWSPVLAEDDGGGTTLVIGSGLTAVDVALSQCGRSPRSRVVAVSRHGRLPFGHLPGLRRAAPAPALGDGTLRLDALERDVRAHVARCGAAGFDWRDALDGLRPDLPALWGRMPLLDRRRFLRERARSWEIRRHRMAPEVAAAVATLRATGRLTVLAGGVESLQARPGGVELRLRDGRTVRGARAVACTGAGTDVTATPDPLLRALLADGVASADPLGLGLRATPSGALLDASGRSDGRVWVLGALRRGELWESTAVPELREQAAEVAGGLRASLSDRAADPVAVSA